MGVGIFQALTRFFVRHVWIDPQGQSTASLTETTGSGGERITGSKLGAVGSKPYICPQPKYKEFQIRTQGVVLLFIEDIRSKAVSGTGFDIRRAYLQIPGGRALEGHRRTMPDLG